MTRPTPILFLGDAPELPGGLSRIGRDLAVLVSSMPEYRVGYLGRGGVGSRRFPFQQYGFPESGQWGEDYLERAWNDFAGDERGVIFTVWDPSRLLWFARPEYMTDPELQAFLASGRFKRWGYFAVDSLGPGGRLSVELAAVLQGYDRRLFYTRFGRDAAQKTLGIEDDWIPHGMSLEAFQRRDRTAGRVALGVPKNKRLVGMVATNQPRKDWGLAMTAFADLAKWDHVWHFWCHTDVPVRAWSLPALIQDLGLGGRVTVSYHMSDEELSYAYSACDLTVLPSLGEGFGYTVVESLACGTPVIVGSYGGQSELVQRDEWKVEPHAWRLETPYNCLRPVYRPEDWMEAILKFFDCQCEVDCRAMVEHLEWRLLFHSVWRKWFQAGVPA
jgi:glycosyltransferase involved in cell wall biosynthesis